MMPLSSVDILSRMLDPVTRHMSRQAAEQLVNLRADARAQARIEELADKNTEGTLTPEEKAEYDAIVTAAGLIAFMQSKARAILANSPHAA